MFTDMSIDEVIDKMEEEYNNRKWYIKITDKVRCCFNNIPLGYDSFLQGIKNLIKYRKLIWSDRWYDSTFLHQMLRFKLNDMAQEWKNAHYVGSEYEEKLLKELVQLLDDIDALEDDFNPATYGMIDNKYQEFGIKLFSIQKVTKYNKDFENGEDTSVCTNMSRLWD